MDDINALVLSFAHLKGGVGKTAITLHSADALHLAGKRVLVVDLDPQGTARQWAAVGASSGVDGPPVVGVEGGALLRDLPRLAQGVDVVLIDCPPRLGRDTRAAMMASDLVVVPMVPGPESVWALGETLEVLEEARAIRPVRACSVLNRAKATGVARATREALEGSSVPMVTEALGDRVAYAEAVSLGRGVRSYAPSSAAAGELEGLVTRMLTEAAR